MSSERSALSIPHGWIIVTGGNAGIGFETCKTLAELGCKVILCSRDKAKGEAAVQRICDALPNAIVELMIVDTSDMDSVRKFASDFDASEKELGVLVNNAGMLPHFKDRVRHGIPPHNWEIAMATNHLGPFLLTNLLLSHLKKHAAAHGAARVVVVASSYTEQKNSGRSFDVTDIMYEKPGSYGDGGDAYRNSKAANMMFTYELARRLSGSGVVVNCLCPGFVPATQLARHHGAAAQWIMTNIAGGFIGTKIFRLPSVTVRVAAERVVAVAVGEIGKSVSGQYFKHGVVTVSPDYTRNEEQQRQLWDISARLTGVV